MAQGLLPYQYDGDERSCGSTAWAGLPVVLDLTVMCGLIAAIDERLRVRAHGRGWPDRVVVIALILLNLAGGDCVEDVRTLAADDGLRRVLLRTFLHGLPRKERRRLERRMKKNGETPFPSPDAVLRYLYEFHDESEETKREAGTAFIPEPTEALRALYALNGDLLGFAQQWHPLEHATLDLDATLVESHKQSALFCYKKFPAYQPLQAYWAEREMMAHSQFRDGNVPAGYQQLRFLKETLAMMPDGVLSISLRSDAAGYEVDLLKYCAEGKNERFGVIEFAISADVTEAFRTAVDELPETEWKPLLRDIGGGCQIDTGQQYAEVVYVPNWAGHSKHTPDYRFLAIREPLQRDLPGLEPEVQTELPFQTMTAPTGQRYKLFALVTNRHDVAGDELIWWHRQRCGKSEQAHAIMKNDLAGGQLPSALFGANAAWWAIMILAFNLLALFKRLALPPQFVPCRTKALRFRLFAVAGRVVRHGRQLLIRIATSNPALSLLMQARQRIANWPRGPTVDTV